MNAKEKLNRLKKTVLKLETEPSYNIHKIKCRRRCKQLHECSYLRDFIKNNSCTPCMPMFYILLDSVTFLKIYITIYLFVCLKHFHAARKHALDFLANWVCCEFTEILPHLTLSFPQSCKRPSKFSKLPPILKKQTEKKLLL